jgi:hypothetical protein
MPPISLKPGEFASIYAERLGWKLHKGNLMVEGDSDVALLQLASKLYLKKYGRLLLGPDFNVFSPGSGDLGGIPGILEQLPLLLKVVDNDPGSDGKRVFKVAALVDSDYAGRRCVTGLLNQYRNLRANVHIFELQRVFPMTASEVNALTSQIQKMNALWQGLDTEIEDLLSADFLDLFRSENHHAAKAAVLEKDGERHFDFNLDAKAALVRFSKDNASLNDVARLVDLLRAFRFYFALPSDGLAA